MLQRVWTIARWTLVELLRERVLYVVLLFAAVLVGGSTVLTPLTPGAQKKVVVDLGLAAIDALGILVILLSGTSIVRRDMDRRSLDVLLTKPLTRLEYLGGKWLGLVATLLVLTVAMSVILITSLEVCGFGWQARYLPAILGSGLGMLVMASIAVLFSTFTSPMLGALFTLALFVGGSLSEGMLRTVGAAGGNPLLESLSLAIPNMGLFNLRGDAVHGTGVAPGQFLVASCYAVLYVATALTLAATVFRRRDFR
jgi:ABC-type transport system involved in multi-copper enzyme maturation permease subunit